MTKTPTKEQIKDLNDRINKARGRVVVKSGWFWTVLHWIVFAVTFGGNRSFLRGYYTTIGPWIGVPEDWRGAETPVGFAVLEHELVHVQQCAKFGFGSPILGLPLFTLFYLLLPLPFGFAYFRWRFERSAYVRGINVRMRYSPILRGSLINQAVRQLTSGKYGWTWPFKKNVHAYFEAQEPFASAPWAY